MGKPLTRLVAAVSFSTSTARPCLRRYSPIVPSAVATSGEWYRPISAMVLKADIPSLNHDVESRAMLDRRAQILLKTLVERYIAEGEPVGSRALSRYSGLDLSPATIRNVMAELEELGFVASPHTSAGRIPTARGYRFFVDTLLTLRPLDTIEINQLEGQLHAGNRQRLVTSRTYSPSELVEAANILNEKYAGLTFEETRKRVHEELKQLRADMTQLM